MDLGTGDGRSVLARATADRCALVLGIDAAAAAMAESSRRADRAQLANAIFLVAGAEALADADWLAGTTHLVTVTFPWGSLLRGVLGVADGAILDAIASVLRPDGRLDVLASIVPTDGVPGMPCLDATAEAAIAATWRRAGLELASMRPATPAEIDASGSTWARRLAAGRRVGTDRSVWRLSGGRTAGS